MGAKAARSQSRLGVFVLVVPDARRGFYPSLHTEFAEQAGASNHQVIVCNSNNDLGKQADIFFRLMDMNVAGVAVVPTTVGSPPTHQIRQLQLSGVPVVLLHRGMEGISAPTLLMPYEDIASCAARKLLEHGHDRIACFFAGRNSQNERYEARFRHVLEEAGDSLPPEMVVVGRSLHEPMSVHARVYEAALRELMELPAHRQPTAIWASYDTQAELLYLLLTKMGVRIPEQMSLLSFGGVWRNGPLATYVSAVTADEGQAGARAAQLLDEMQRGTRPLEDDEAFTIPLGFHDGQTLTRPEL